MDNNDDIARDGTPAGPRRLYGPWSRKFMVILAILSTFSVLLLVHESYSGLHPRRQGFSYSVPDRQLLHRTEDYITIFDMNNDQEDGIKALTEPDDYTNPGISTDRKVFDVILFNDELELLEIRLHELDAVVNTFIIIESAFSFSRKPKPLHYQDNKGRYAKFHHKIVHIIPPKIEQDELERMENLSLHAWAYELSTRSKGTQMGIELVEPKEGDWIMLSDLDELPRPSVIRAFKSQDLQTKMGRQFAEDKEPGREDEAVEDVFKLECKFFQFSYEFRVVSENWIGPVLVRYRLPTSPALLNTTEQGDQDKGTGPIKKYPQRDLLMEIAAENWKDAGSKMRDVRKNAGVKEVKNACWHCSWCFANMSTVVNKIRSYSHWGYDQDQFTNQAWLLDRFSHGLHLYNETETYEYVENSMDIPGYIQDHRERYSYMVERKDKANAGFLDVDPSSIAP